MSARHTPGPWRIGRFGAVVADVPVPEIAGSDNVAYYGGHLVAESIAPQNELLIAAAPDLLAALQAISLPELVQQIRQLPTVRMPEIDGEESDGTPRPYVSRTQLERLLTAHVDSVRTAIAKATGGAA